MGLSQRQKGKRVEREAVALLKSLGHEAERSVQHCGNSEESADVRTDIDGVRVEVKGGYDDIDVASKTVGEWLQKLGTEANGSEVGLILWKRSRRSWLAVFEYREIRVVTPDIAEAIELLRLRASSRSDG